MRADQRIALTTINPPTEESTPASLWRAITRSPISDQLLEWPADLFALTEVILERSEVYRFTLSPPGGGEWPPRRYECWSEAVVETGRQWSIWVEDRESTFPGLLADEWRVFRERIEIPLDDLAEGRDWRMCEAVLTLHAVADEACAGLGMALDRCEGKGCVYRARGRELMARTGSLARIQPHFLRVLPKMRTPASGTSLRSFSRYASVHGPGVAAQWHKVPVRRRGTDPTARHVNLLLLPWPLRVRESDFRPVEGSVRSMATESFGFFEFSPSEKLDLDLVDRLIVATQDEVDTVDAVLLPESAVDESEVDGLEALLERHSVAMLITGVRQRSSQRRRLPGNWVHIGISSRLEKGVSVPNSTAEQWFHIRQNKHNRWSLDEGQILQYHLGGALHPHVRWWEAMDVPRRTIHFVEHGEEIVLVALICEDLAQIDSVAEVIRSVGPTAVITPLLDGPQLNSRWAARYASVLADDPGSAVLTLTSFGMVQRCRPHGRGSSPVVALWKDPVRGVREIPLEPGAQGILLTLCGAHATRRSADGRRPVDNLNEHFDAAVYQVRADGATSRSSNCSVEALPPSVLDTDDLTILTGWAQALAEGLAYAPECVEHLLLEARPGAPWRAALGIPEPSEQFGEAISIIRQSIRAAASPSDQPTIDVLLNSCQKDRPGQHGLEALVRRVLRSTLEQLRSRQAKET